MFLNDEIYDEFERMKESSNVGSLEESDDVITVYHKKDRYLLKFQIFDK